MPPMTEDEFNRLPEDVKRGILEKQRDDGLRAKQYKDRIKSRATTAAIAAGVLAAAATVVISPFVGFWLDMGTMAALGAYATVHYRLSLLGGILAIGIPCTIQLVIGAGNGWCAGLFGFVFVYCGIGGAIGLWASGRRSIEDAGF